ncbi:unnamed protein product (macronuclear) [Paramecium tetraurelia]|uniref:Ubiquitin fusion degradation protein n=1 Tax=Paramecium tetraurelia TaxID=5888 RepID=A0CQS3_PARTE|nr:uncharacterized protein GSPATT00009488001 [Paramecium tetraurelia]CAK73140.1 unnamed protein product [Paramecium tetraurelia]|eukprot:XP_001440537.1 hypothetical protein (macronuclear) [Paramecium tetraurelia strain d4-2]
MNKCQCGTLEVYSASSQNKKIINHGNRILLPPSILLEICNVYCGTMTFKLQSVLEEKKSIYVGVLEFTADEGTCVVPDWIFDAMGFSNGLSIPINCNRINKFGSLIKVQPHKSAFIKLSDPKDILKTYLKNFTCLTQDETITINYQDVNYLIDIVKVEPINKHNAICIDEFYFDIDLMDPLDLTVHPKLLFESSEAQQEKIITCEQQPVFQGIGILIGGEPLNTDQSSHQKIDMPVKQYDPRKQKLFNGLRQVQPNVFYGPSVKLFNIKTRYNLVDHYRHKQMIL